MRRQSICKFAPSVVRAHHQGAPGLLPILRLQLLGFFDLLSWDNTLGWFQWSPACKDGHFLTLIARFDIEINKGWNGTSHGHSGSYVHNFHHVHNGHIDHIVHNVDNVHSVHNVHDITTVYTVYIDNDVCNFYNVIMLIMFIMFIILIIFIMFIKLILFMRFKMFIMVILFIMFVNNNVHKDHNFME
jgi:hypothetical protein